MRFYQKYWYTVDEDVSSVVLRVLSGESMIFFINSTFIALISKKQDVIYVNDFRLISLCNVIYKLVFKTITNRLKPLINEIISHNQSAFILDQFIFDNIMIAHEMLHSLNKLRKGKNDKMAVKLDMFKAYDRVE